MIHVLAIVTTKPGTRARFIDAYRANLPNVLAEDGCLAYEAVIDVEPTSPGFAQFGPDVFVVVERWASRDALQAHAAAPHMKAYNAQVRDWAASTAIHVLEAA
jgi:quinol monooxygenase YgiN